MGNIELQEGVVGSGYSWVPTGELSELRSSGASRSSYDSALGKVHEIELWSEWSSLRDSLSSRPLLDELHRRHSAMVHSRIRSYAMSNSSVGEFDDFKQEAFIGMMSAYRRFDLDVASACGRRLSSWVVLTAHKHVLTACDRSGFCGCSSSMRSSRSYVRGWMSSERAADFESQRGLHTTEDRQRFVAEHALLGSQFVPFSSMQSHNSNDTDIDSQDWSGGVVFHNDIAESESQIIDRVWMEQEMSNLTDAYHDVMALRYERGLSYAEMASELGITETQVRGRMYEAKARLRARAKESKLRS